MAHPKGESYILLVAEDGDRLEQWAIRVDHLLVGLAVGLLLAASIVALPLLAAW